MGLIRAALLALLGGCRMTARTIETGSRIPVGVLGVGVPKVLPPHAPRLWEAAYAYPADQARLLP